MSSLPPYPPMPMQQPYPTEYWHGYPERRESEHGSNVLPILALAALGLGILAAVYLAPDIKRYVRIHNM